MKKIQLPGSKSITNRVLILAALGDQPMELHNLLDSDDARYMQAALVEFGVRFESIGKNAVKVFPPEQLQISGKELFIGNAGTAARFLSALSLVAKGSFVLTGIKRMRERPQADLQGALKDLGVEVGSLANEGFLPTRFTNLKTIDDSMVELSGNVSSQFLTALMLVAPRLEKGLTIKINGEVPSWPYIEMTLELLRIWGVSFSLIDQEEIQITPGIRPPESYNIPSDMSSASYPLLWSVISKTPIEITNFGEKTLQGDEAFLEVIEAVGAKIIRSGNKCQIFPADQLRQMGDWDWSAMPDVSMTGMILAACSEGVSVFTGLESLRVKECDRIVAMEQLRILGVEVQVEGDDMTIVGNSQRLVAKSDIEIKSYDDHRIAMCFGVLRGVKDLAFKISEPHCVAKTWPQFWVELADWENQLRAVSAVILQQQDLDTTASECKYLIVEKPRKDNAWQFPQGGVDPGETGLQAAKRELNEECGANLSVKFKGERSVGYYGYLFPTGFKRHDKNVRGARVDFYKADYISGPVEVDGQEIINHAWVTKSEIPNYVSESYWNEVKDLL